MDRQRHPLGDMMTDEEFAQLANDVQFCRISWPICVVIKGEEEVTDTSLLPEN